MTEREMEDLLWEHPGKLLNEKLTQFARQQSSRVGRSDLIFTDRLGRLLVLEVKKGKLPRGAIDQLFDYFGMVKKQFPGKPVELMVVANSIPEERRLACDQYNIEWREITEKRFRDLADEVGYEFDSEKDLRRSTDLPTTRSDRPTIATRSSPNVGTRSFGMFHPDRYGYSLKADFDRNEFKRLLDAFIGVRKRDIDKSLAVRLEQELLERTPPRIERATFLQLARWCNTNNPVYWDGMDVARKISQLLFGRVLDRKELGI